MTKTEFLEKLQAALEQNVDPGTLRENMEYYSQYITDEMRKGKSQEEVTDALGDPWAIARTIIDTSGNGPGSETNMCMTLPVRTATAAGILTAAATATGVRRRPVEAYMYLALIPGGKNCFWHWQWQEYFC